MGYAFGLDGENEDELKEQALEKLGFEESYDELGGKKQRQVDELVETAGCLNGDTASLEGVVSHYTEV